jgi:hypothetical protein
MSMARRSLLVVALACLLVLSGTCTSGFTAATLDRPATVDVAGPNDGYLGIEYPELTCPVTDDAVAVLHVENRFPATDLQDVSATVVDTAGVEATVTTTPGELDVSETGSVELDVDEVTGDDTASVTIRLRAVADHTALVAQLSRTVTDVPTDCGVTESSQPKALSFVAGCSLDDSDGFSVATTETNDEGEPTAVTLAAGNPGAVVYRAGQTVYAVSDPGENLTTGDGRALTGDDGDLSSDPCASAGFDDPVVKYENADGTWTREGDEESDSSG